MKKSFTKVLLAAAAMFCVSPGASAYSFYADGIYYNITSEAGKTVEVTSGENKYFGDVSIPATVEEYGGDTYTVTKIGSYAFSRCENLESINIPDGVKSIGGDAFSGCFSLESVTLGSGLETIGYNAFSDCISLTEINCRATVPPVCGPRSFDGVDKTACTLNVPEGAEEAYKTADGWKEFLYEYFMSGGIRYGALTSSQGNIATVLAGGEYTGDIAIPATVENGGITYTVTEIYDRAFSDCSDLVYVDIPDGVVSIGERAFYGCSDLASIDIPDGVISIGDYAFYGCGSLESVTLGSGVETIGDFAFSACRSLASIDIPDGVVSIGGNAFYNCSSLKSVTLGRGLKTIGYEAFMNCGVLASIDIPDGVTSISDYAFYECSSLESVTIPNSVTSIGYSAFSDCSSLASIDIPGGVASIGEGAFSGCSSLTEINCRATVPPVCGERCFADVDINNCTLSVPEGTADDYRAADGWKEFFNIVETDFAGSGEIAADATAAAKVYAAAGRIVVENAAAGTPIAVYTADGVQVYGGTASGGRTEIPAQAGKLYIVRCGNAAYKTAM